MSARRPRATLTVCTITLNEEQRLPAALDSVAGLADEIVVVDSGSRDGTVGVAAARGARVIEHPWHGFARQRNVALDAARGDWVLELDADERVTPELAAEMSAFLALPPPPAIDAGVIPMRHRFLGRTLGPAGRYPFYRTRLLRRGRYRHDEDRAVHEGLRPRTAPWVFRADLEHTLAAGLGEALTDSYSYARLSARSIARVTRRDLARGVIARPAAKFVFNAAILGAVRDGPIGLTRLALECAGDAATWILARRSGPGAGGGAAGHFGRWSDATGPIHLLAVGDPRGHWRWLQSATTAGALVSVVCGAAHAAARLDGGERLRVRPGSPGPLAQLRLADAEAQICPVSARIALDRMGALILRAVPGRPGPLIDPRRAAAADIVRAPRSPAGTLIAPRDAVLRG